MTVLHRASLILLWFPTSVAVRPLDNLVSDAGIGAAHLQHHLQQFGQRQRHLTLDPASLLGNVALTLVVGTPQQNNGASVGITGTEKLAGSSVYGPFEAGFGSRQDNVIQRQFGCTTDTTRCYSEGGLDVVTAEALCATQCEIKLPRTEDDIYYGMLDSCGGHTQYHFHRSMKCLYVPGEEDQHSPILAETTASRGGGQIPNPGGGGGGGGGPPPGGGGGAPATRRLQADVQNLYGAWEDFARQQLPVLDACNGHWGFTPDSPDEMIYHYHITDQAPFTVGCLGPNEDDSLVSVSQCRTVYEGCSDTTDLEVFTILDDGVEKKIPYQHWCPCFDKSTSGFNGAGLNVGNASPDRGYYVRQYLNNEWVTTETGSLRDVGFTTGIAMAEIETQEPVLPMVPPVTVTAAPTGIPVAAAALPVSSPTNVPTAAPMESPTTQPVVASTDSPTTTPSQNETNVTQESQGTISPSEGLPFPSSFPTPVDSPTSAPVELPAPTDQQIDDSLVPPPATTSNSTADTDRDTNDENTTTVVDTGDTSEVNATMPESESSLDQNETQSNDMDDEAESDTSGMSQLVPFSALMYSSMAVVLALIFC